VAERPPLARRPNIPDAPPPTIEGGRTMSQHVATILNRGK
jgi:hypothetical protein